MSGWAYAQKISGHSLQPQDDLLATLSPESLAKNSSNAFWVDMHPEEHKEDFVENSGPKLVSHIRGVASHGQEKGSQERSSGSKGPTRKTTTAVPSSPDGWNYAAGLTRNPSPATNVHATDPDLCVPDPCRAAPVDPYAHRSPASTAWEIPTQPEDEVDLDLFGKNRPRPRPRGSWGLAMEAAISPEKEPTEPGPSLKAAHQRRCEPEAAAAGPREEDAGPSGVDEPETEPPVCHEEPEPSPPPPPPKEQPATREEGELDGHLEDVTNHDGRNGYRSYAHHQPSPEMPPPQPKAAPMGTFRT